MSTGDNNDKDDNNGVFFDDYGGRFPSNGGGDLSPSSSLLNLLQSRMGKVRGTKAA